MLLYPLLLCLITAQTQTIIHLGSSLTAHDNSLYWVSPNGEFAFGFQRIGEHGFLLAIWFDKIPERTIVWSANGNSLLQEGSRVELTKSGSLVLNDPTGKHVWTAGIASGVAYAAMLHTGNFVLANEDSVNLWESFNEPTDTLLPTQTLTRGKRLVARYSDANYSKGRFGFILRPDGNLVLYTRAFPLDAVNFDYWSSKTVGSGFRVIFNQSGFIYVEAKNETILNMLSLRATSTTDFYQRAILEYDGVFRHYVYPKSNNQSSKGWKKAWSHSSTSIPSDICTSITENTGGGACGFNSYCRLGNEQRPNCYCPNGYNFIDPNDRMKGCKQTFEAQSCDEGSWEADDFDFNTMENTDWPLSDYEYFQGVNEDWCRKACLGDCFCAVAIFRNRECWKKKIPLSNGRIDPNDGGKALIKVRIDNSTYKPGDPDAKKKFDSMLVLVGSVLLSSSVFLNVSLLIAAFLVLLHFNQKAKGVEQTQFMPGMYLRSFTYAELEKATNRFNEELGKGAFATVFKGVLAFGNKNLVAVKKMNNMVIHGEKEFDAEVSSIGGTNHKNLVKLIGFCNEGQHRILVYEFMSNGSLSSFLFGTSRPNWSHRMQIAMGIARGLFYLHEECSNQIIHCDIKPQNVLLDDYLTARIADFGLAKILKMDQTRTTTQIRGTRGYVAPEWFRNMPVTTKVDVYSYGILLLELVCCRKNFDAGATDENQMILADWAYDCYIDGKLDQLMENDDEAKHDMKRVEKFVMVAIWCIQEDPSLRPTMKKVTQMLEGTIQVSIPPNPSSFISSL
ncbi:hypothetical protein UlMin_030419 [Ulmus minor]